MAGEPTVTLSGELRTEPEAAVIHAHPDVVPVVSLSPLLLLLYLRTVTAELLENHDAVWVMSL